MRTRSGRHAILAAGLAIALLGSACGSGSSGAARPANAGKPVYGGTLVIGRESDTAGLDTQTLINGEDMIVKRLLYTSLVDTKPDGTGIEPSLATSWTFDQASNTYTFHLRPAKFSDGSPITASDVKFSLQYDAKGAFYGGLFSRMGTITVVDPETLRIQLKSYDSLFLIGLAFGFVVPKGFDGESSKAFFKDPIASGPYTLQKWIPGDDMVLTKNTKFWDYPARPYIDKIEYRIIPDANQTQVAFQSGAIQLYEYLPYQISSSIPASELYRVEPTARVMLVALNAASAPFNNIKAREAFSLAINRTALLGGIWHNHGVAATGIVQPGVPDRTSCPQANWGDYNPKAAQSLLQQTGQSTAFTFLSPNEREVEPNVTQAVLANLTAAGFKAKLDTEDYNSAINDLVAQKFQAFMLGNGSYLPTAGESLLFYAGTFAPLSGWPDLARNTALFNRYRSAKTTAGRKAAVAQYECYVYQTKSIIPIAAPDLLFGVSDKLHDFQTAPSGLYEPDRMWLSK